VCDGDEFQVDRGKIMRHAVNYRDPRGTAYAYYVLITFKDGTEKSEVMTRDECEAIRKRSRAGSSGPWVSDFDEMAKKTVFRRASKWLPLSPEIQDVIRRDEATEFRNVTPPPQPAINPFALSTPETAENAATVILDPTEQEVADEP
jgi:recombination protein RecT